MSGHRNSDIPGTSTLSEEVKMSIRSISSEITIFEIKNPIPDRTTASGFGQISAPSSTKNMVHHGHGHQHLNHNRHTQFLQQASPQQMQHLTLNYSHGHGHKSHTNSHRSGSGINRFLATNNSSSHYSLIHEDDQNSNEEIDNRFDPSTMLETQLFEEEQELLPQILHQSRSQQQIQLQRLQQRQQQHLLQQQLQFKQLQQQQLSVRPRQRQKNPLQVVDMEDVIITSEPAVLPQLPPPVVKRPGPGRPPSASTLLRKANANSGRQPPPSVPKPGPGKVPTRRKRRKRVFTPTRLPPTPMTSTYRTRTVVKATLAAESLKAAEEEKAKLAATSPPSPKARTMKEVLDSIPGFGGGRPKKRSNRKLSTAEQLEQTKKEGLIDFETPGSILTHVNLRAILNKHTFGLFPYDIQKKLSELLPEVDRITNGPEGDRKLNSSALSNEFFAKACTEWTEKLLAGEFTPEQKQRNKQEAERERLKLDPWKVKHFEPIWGLKTLPSATFPAKDVISSSSVPNEGEMDTSSPSPDSSSRNKGLAPPPPTHGHCLRSSPLRSTRLSPLPLVSSSTSPRVRTPSPVPESSRAAAARILASSTTAAAALASKVMSSAEAKKQAQVNKFKMKEMEEEDEEDDEEDENDEDYELEDEDISSEEEDIDQPSARTKALHPYHKSTSLSASSTKRGSEVLDNNKPPVVSKKIKMTPPPPEKVVNSTVSHSTPTTTPIRANNLSPDITVTPTPASKSFAESVMDEEMSELAGDLLDNISGAKNTYISQKVVESIPGLTITPSPKPPELTISPVAQILPLQAQLQILPLTKADLSFETGRTVIVSGDDSSNHSQKPSPISPSPSQTHISSPSVPDSITITPTTAPSPVVPQSTPSPQPSSLHLKSDVHIQRISNESTTTPPPPVKPKQPCGQQELETLKAEVKIKCESRSGPTLVSVKTAPPRNLLNHMTSGKSRTPTPPAVKQPPDPIPPPQNLNASLLSTTQLQIPRDVTITPAKTDQMSTYPGLNESNGNSLPRITVSMSPVTMTPAIVNVSPPATIMTAVTPAIPSGITPKTDFHLTVAPPPSISDPLSVSCEPNIIRDVISAPESKNDDSIPMEIKNILPPNLTVVKSEVKSSSILTPGQLTLVQTPSPVSICPATPPVPTASILPAPVNPMVTLIVPPSQSPSSPVNSNVQVQNPAVINPNQQAKVVQENAQRVSNPPSNTPSSTVKSKSEPIEKDKSVSVVSNKAAPMPPKPTTVDSSTNTPPRPVRISVDSDAQKKLQAKTPPSPKISPPVNVKLSVSVGTCTPPRKTPFIYPQTTTTTATTGNSNTNTTVPSPILRTNTTPEVSIVSNDVKSDIKVTAAQQSSPTPKTPVPSNVQVETIVTVAAKVETTSANSNSKTPVSGAVKSNPPVSETKATAMEMQNTPHDKTVAEPLNTKISPMKQQSQPSSNSNEPVKEAQPKVIVAKSSTTPNTMESRASTPEVVAEKPKVVEAPKKEVETKTETVVGVAVKCVNKSTGQTQPPVQRQSIQTQTPTLPRKVSLPPTTNIQIQIGPTIGQQKVPGGKNAVPGGQGQTLALPLAKTDTPLIRIDASGKNVQIGSGNQQQTKVQEQCLQPAPSQQKNQTQNGGQKGKELSVSVGNPNPIKPPTPGQLQNIQTQLGPQKLLQNIQSQSGNQKQQNVQPQPGVQVQVQLQVQAQGKPTQAQTGSKQVQNVQIVQGGQQRQPNVQPQGGSGSGLQKQQQNQQPSVNQKLQSPQQQKQQQIVQLPIGQCQQNSQNTPQTQAGQPKQVLQAQSPQQNNQAQSQGGQQKQNVQVQAQQKLQSVQPSQAAAGQQKQNVQVQPGQQQRQQNSQQQVGQLKGANQTQQTKQNQQSQTGQQKSVQNIQAQGQQKQTQNTTIQVGQLKQIQIVQSPVEPQKQIVKAVAGQKQSIQIQPNTAQQPPGQQQTVQIQTVQVQKSQPQMVQQNLQAQVQSGQPQKVQIQGGQQQQTVNKPQQKIQPQPLGGQQVKSQCQAGQAQKIHQQAGQIKIQAQPAQAQTGQQKIQPQPAQPQSANQQQKIQQQPNQQQKIQPQPNQQQKIQPQPTQQQKIQPQPNQQQKIQPQPNQQQKIQLQPNQQQKIQPQPNQQQKIQPQPNQQLKIQPQPNQQQKIQPQPNQQQKIQPQPNQPQKIQPQPNQQQKIQPQPNQQQKIQPQPNQQQKIQPQPNQQQKIQPQANQQQIQAQPNQKIQPQGNQQKIQPQPNQQKIQPQPNQQQKIQPQLNQQQKIQPQGQVGQQKIVIQTVQQSNAKNQVQVAQQPRIQVQSAQPQPKIQIQAVQQQNIQIQTVQQQNIQIQALPQQTTQLQPGQKIQIQVAQHQQKIQIQTGGGQNQKIISQQMQTVQVTNSPQPNLQQQQSQQPQMVPTAAQTQLVQVVSQAMQPPILQTNAQLPQTSQPAKIALSPAHPQQVQGQPGLPPLSASPQPPGGQLQQPQQKVQVTAGQPGQQTWVANTSSTLVSSSPPQSINKGQTQKPRPKTKQVCEVKVPRTSSVPPGTINLERSYQICRAVIQNSPNREQLQNQLVKPPPVVINTKIDAGKLIQQQQQSQQQQIQSHHIVSDGQLIQVQRRASTPTLIQTPIQTSMPMISGMAPHQKVIVAHISQHPGTNGPVSITTQQQGGPGGTTTVVPLIRPVQPGSPLIVRPGGGTQLVSQPQNQSTTIITPQQLAMLLQQQQQQQSHNQQQQVQQQQRTQTVPLPFVNVNQINRPLSQPNRPNSASSVQLSTSNTANPGSNSCGTNSPQPAQNFKIINQAHTQFFAAQTTNTSNNPTNSPSSTPNPPRQQIVHIPLQQRAPVPNSFPVRAQIVTSNGETLTIHRASVPLNGPIRISRPPYGFNINLAQMKRLPQNFITINNSPNGSPGIVTTSNQHPPQQQTMEQQQRQQPSPGIIHQLQGQTFAVSQSGPTTITLTRANPTTNSGQGQQQNCVTSTGTIRIQNVNLPAENFPNFSTNNGTVNVSGNGSSGGNISTGNTMFTSVTNLAEFISSQLVASNIRPISPLATIENGQRVSVTPESKNSSGGLFTVQQGQQTFTDGGNGSGNVNLTLGTPPHGQSNSSQQQSRIGNSAHPPGTVMVVSVMNSNGNSNPSPSSNTVSVNAMNGNPPSTSILDGKSRFSHNPMADLINCTNEAMLDFHDAISASVDSPYSLISESEPPNIAEIIDVPTSNEMIAVPTSSSPFPSNNINLNVNQLSTNPNNSWMKQVQIQELVQQTSSNSSLNLPQNLTIAMAGQSQKQISPPLMTTLTNTNSSTNPSSGLTIPTAVNVNNLNLTNANNNNPINPSSQNRIDVTNDVVEHNTILVQVRLPSNFLSLSISFPPPHYSSIIL